MLNRIGLFSAFARCERFGRPWVPVHRIPGVLQQVRTGFRRQTVGHCEMRLGSSVLRHDARRVPEKVIRDGQRESQDAARPAPAPHARRAQEPKLPWHRRIPWWAVVVTLAVIVTAAFAVEPIRDAVTFEGVGEAHLELSPGYIALAPLSAILDTVTLLTIPQHIAVVIWIIGVYAVWRLLASSTKPDARREIIGAATLLGAIVVTYAAAAFLPRPMAALTVSDETVLAADFHSHTEASHDGRKGWTDDDVRDWHRDAGFDVAYITDHRSFSGAERGRRVEPAGRGAGNDDPSRHRSGVPRRACEHSQRRPALQRPPHRRPRRPRRAGVADGEHHPADDAGVDRDDSRTTWTRFRRPVRSWVRAAACRRSRSSTVRRADSRRAIAIVRASTRSSASSTSRRSPGPTTMATAAPRPGGR